jgi:hypothetical protein
MNARLNAAMSFTKIDQELIGSGGCLEIPVIKDLLGRPWGVESRQFSQIGVRRLGRKDQQDSLPGEVLVLEEERLELPLHCRAEGGSPLPDQVTGRVLGQGCALRRQRIAQQGQKGACD